MKRDKLDLTEKLLEELKKRHMFEAEEEDDDEEEGDEDDDDKEDDDDEEDDDENDNDSNEDFCEMVCKILHSRNQAHIFHLQTQSYAEHKALNDYYDGVLGLFDGIVESYQGKYGIIKTYKTFKIEQYKNCKKTISYFDRLLDDIDNLRESVEDSYIQNQIDTVQELINSTLYKLKFLK
jgi:cobalamin biosynthesis protein CobT